MGYGLMEKILKEVINMFTIDEIELLFEILRVFQNEMDNTNPSELDDYEETVATSDSILEKLNKLYKEKKGE
jgi:hypothetical protein